MVLWDSYLLPSSRPPNISLLLFTITVDHLLAISLRRSLGVTCENVYIYGQLPNLLLRPTFHLSRFSRVFQSLSPLSSVLSLSMQTCFSKPQRKGIWSTPSFSTASFLFSSFLQQNSLKELCTPSNAAYSLLPFLPSQSNPNLCPSINRVHSVYSYQWPHSLVTLSLRQSLRSSFSHLFRSSSWIC